MHLENLASHELLGPFGRYLGPSWAPRGHNGGIWALVGPQALSRGGFETFRVSTLTFGGSTLTFRGLPGHFGVYRDISGTTLTFRGLP